MKLAVFATDPAKCGRIAAFADARRFEAWPFDRPQDFASFLFRDPEIAGVFIPDNHLAACDALIEWRMAALAAPLLVLLADRRSGPADLARIIMAGADDAQHLSALPEEIGARMTAISRRRWVAEPIAAPDAAAAALRELASRARAERETPILLPEPLRA